MHERKKHLAALAALALAVGVAGIGRAADEKSAARWRIKGDLTESCTCSVPCSCNFGQGPSPQHYCWALFSYGIQRGRYNDVKLDGLRLAGALGEKGFVMYLDARATPEQAEALKAIAMHIGSTMPQSDDPSLKFLGFKTATIEQVVDDKSCRLKIGDSGGFDAEYLIGIDGKTPIKVENNWSWNITDGIKAKARRLKYEDDFGNKIDTEGVNANQGKFDYNEKTKVFFR